MQGREIPHDDDCVTGMADTPHSHHLDVDGLARRHGPLHPPRPLETAQVLILQQHGTFLCSDIWNHCLRSNLNFFPVAFEEARQSFRGWRKSAAVLLGKIVFGPNIFKICADKKINLMEQTAVYCYKYP